MLLWEYAVAIAGRVIGINPFDQPDVESAKQAARGLLDGSPGPTRPTSPTARRGPGHAGPARRRRRRSAGAVAALLGALDGEHGYLAVMAYLDRLADAVAGRRPGRAGPAYRPAGDVRLGPAVPALHRPVPQGRPADRRLPADHRRAARDLEIPGRPFTFGGFISAQATGDAQVLADHGRPVLRLHLTDRAAGLAQLQAAADRRPRAAA